MVGPLVCLAVIAAACLFAWWVGRSGASAGLTAVVTDETSEIPPGLYEFPPGMDLTGYEPPSFYLPFKVGSAKRPILRYAPT